MTTHASFCLRKMAEAEIDAMLSKKYADLEADFAALLGPSLLAPAQAYDEMIFLIKIRISLCDLVALLLLLQHPLSWYVLIAIFDRVAFSLSSEQVKVAFDLSSQAEIAKVLEARGGADPNAVAAIRARTNTKLVRNSLLSVQIRFC